jgi:hypothetical protein
VQTLHVIIACRKARCGLTRMYFGMGLADVADAAITESGILTSDIPISWIIQLVYHLHTSDCTDMSDPALDFLQTIDTSKRAAFLCSAAMFYVGMCATDSKAPLCYDAKRFCETIQQVCKLALYRAAAKCCHLLLSAACPSLNQYTVARDDSELNCETVHCAACGHVHYTRHKTQQVITAIAARRLACIITDKTTYQQQSQCEEDCQRLQYIYQSCRRQITRAKAPTHHIAAASLVVPPCMLDLHGHVIHNTRHLNYSQRLRMCAFYFHAGMPVDAVVDMMMKHYEQTLERRKHAGDISTLLATKRKELDSFLSKLSKSNTVPQESPCSSNRFCVFSDCDAATRISRCTKLMQDRLPGAGDIEDTCLPLTPSTQCHRINMAYSALSN